MSYWHKKTKTLREFRKKTTKKKCWDWISRAREVKALFKNVWTVWWTRDRKTFSKTHWPIFDWSKNRFDRSKITFDWSSINWVAIEPGRFKPSFLSQFWSVEQQVRSIENLEKSIFWKTEHFNAKTLQSTIFYEWNAWVWDEKFFKNPWI